MNTKIKIKNFKCFDDNGIDIQLNPITFLTGENSSGKSSFTKAILLLQDYFGKSKHSGNLQTECLDFSKIDSGDFDSIVNNMSNEKEFTFCIDNKSKYYQNKVQVIYTFGERDGDYAKNGWLKRIKIIDANGDALLSWNGDGNKKNIIKADLFKESFFKFANSFLKEKGKEIQHCLPEYKTIFGVESIENFDDYNQLKNSCERQIIFDFSIINLLASKNKNEIINQITEFIIDNPKYKELQSFITDLSESDKSFLELIKDKEDENLNNSSFIGDTQFAEIAGIQPNFLSEFYHESSFIKEIELFDKKSRNSKGINASSLNLDKTTTSKYFTNYLKLVLKDLIIIDFLKKNKYIKTTDIQIKRIYQNNDNSLGIIVIEYFTSLFEYNNKPCSVIENEEQRYIPNTFMNKWIKEFGIADSIDIQVADNSAGYFIYLINKKNKTLLADEGYGITKIVTMLISIETAILQSNPNFVVTKEPDFFNNNNWEGYYDYPKQTIVIEEPEAHLHPKFQSLLCDIFYDAFKAYNVRFLIETHSEYIIRKSQVLVSKMDLKDNEQAEKKTPFRTYYFSKNEKPYSLGYRADGKFINEFGPGFYDESSNLIFSIL